MSERAESKWIMGPGLDWLLYTKRLRELIRELKAKGDFREEGLQRLNVHLAGSILFIISVPVMVLNIEDVGINSATASLCSFVLSIIIVQINRNKQINSEIIPYTIGKKIECKIIEAKYDSIPLYVYGWVIWYSFIDVDVGEVKCVANNIRSEDIGSCVPEVGGRCYVYFDEVSKKRILFVGGWFVRSCLSKARYEERAPEEFRVGGKYGEW